MSTKCEKTVDLIDDFWIPLVFTVIILDFVHRIHGMTPHFFHMDTWIPKLMASKKVNMVSFWVTVSMLNFRAVPFLKHNFIEPS